MFSRMAAIGALLALPLLVAMPTSADNHLIFDSPGEEAAAFENSSTDSDLVFEYVAIAREDLEPLPAVTLSEDDTDFQLISDELADLPAVTGARRSPRLAGAV